LGSDTIQGSFAAVVSVDGLLFAVYYALTGVATAVHHRRQAARGLRDAAWLVALPLAGSAAMAWIVWASVPGLGGWTGKAMVSLYVLLAVGAAAMLAARLRPSAAGFFAR